MMKRFAPRPAVLLLCGAGLWAGAGCTKPALPPAAALAAATEATSLQAPFVLRLAGPAAVPTGGRLDLVAVLETPPASHGLLAIEVEVLLPPGVAPSGLLKQEVRLGGKVRQAVLPLSFQLTGPLTQPIAVRAALRVGRSLGAVAERHYPEPAPTAPASPVEPPGGPRSGQPAGGIPIATPIETAR